jgi:GMP reductase
VMAGGMFAAHDESGGDLIERDGKLYKQFYGMSSSVAMKRHSGGVAEYRASEGKAVTLPYRGPVSDTISDILGGLRSTCTYVGARWVTSFATFLTCFISKLKDLPKRTTFIRVTQQINEVFGSRDEASTR